MPNNEVKYETADKNPSINWMYQELFACHINI